MTDLRTPPVNDGESTGPRHPIQLFSLRAREYAYHKPLQTIQVLEAGCGWGHGLDLGAKECHVTGVDVDTPAVRAHTSGRADLDAWHLGDLRTVPMPPRMYDIVHAHFLIERVAHAELVLDRFVAALKPGGLLLVRFRDRETAYGFVDRALPGWLRALAWQVMSRRTGDPGDDDPGRRPDAPERWLGPEGTPPPAVYETIASLSGMQWYCVMRGLMIAEEYTSVDAMAAFGRWSHLVNGVCRAVAGLSRGRLTAEHSEVTLVIRKPENRLARVI
ncbi:class I SAM-dependent methyltransferase [Actinomadura sp. HBU206391]|uniref:class I SAM-dependent methyltransferase n=1 Tax=Actinomadura sp. HBU206391 TaxID=2731692 RepID=UPI002905B758|nr:class I SAM-dependent methyltransferase [Actinomadura sp. HBU206391]